MFKIHKEEIELDGKKLQCAILPDRKHCYKDKISQLSWEECKENFKKYCL